MSDNTTPRLPLRAVVVDDEPLARQRLSALLSRLDSPPVTVAAELGDAGAALAWFEAHPGEADVCFLDIQMPGPDGLRLADKLGGLDAPPQIVFVTAHAEHALRAFELEALDYLTKPVRRERLLQAVERCQRMRAGQRTGLAAAGSGERDDAGTDAVVLVRERDRVVRVPASDIVYLKAELKYVTVRTLTHTHLVDESLSDIEVRLGDAFIRVHRNALVARAALLALERRDEPDGGEGWAVQVRGTGEWLAVSRRQAPLVREALRGR